MITNGKSGNGHIAGVTSENKPPIRDSNGAVRLELTALNSRKPHTTTITVYGKLGEAVMKHCTIPRRMDVSVKDGKATHIMFGRYVHQPAMSFGALKVNAQFRMCDDNDPVCGMIGFKVKLPHEYKEESGKPINCIVLSGVTPNNAQAMHVEAHTLIVPIP